MTTIQAFLFNADAEGVPSYYGGVFDPALLRALSSADPNGVTSSLLLRGDVLLSQLCMLVKAADNSHKGQSSTWGYDMELYKTVAWDFLDAVADQWHTFDIESLSGIFGSHNIHCITLPSLPLEFREALDSALQGTAGYLGGFEVDRGNPVQRKLFVEMLVDDVVISGGSVTMELGWEGEADTYISGAKQFKPNGEVRVKYGELHNLRPIGLSAVQLSERGQLSADRYAGKRTFSIIERVLSGISQLSSRSLPHFSFKSGEPPAVLEADLPEAKFVKYLLNPDHKDGHGKAKFFREVLGISAADWRYLAAQFYDGLREAALQDLKIKTWENGLGASFNCILPITGLNGRVAIVLTNWIVTPGCLPQLSTAIPAHETSEVSIQPTISRIVPSGFISDERWERLYSYADDAGCKASENCVPTPMKVVGYRVEMEGLCGFASIRVPDARTGFARWLVRSGKGTKHYKSGATIFCSIESQSVDRATAYAKAFASVLATNGIECEVETRLD